MVDCHAVVSGRVFLLNSSALNDVVGATKDGIHLFEADLLGLRYEEPHEGSQEDVDTSEHVEDVKPTVLEEDGEELLDNGVDDILGLGAHADSLSTDVLNIY